MCGCNLKGSILNDVNFNAAKLDGITICEGDVEKIPPELLLLYKSSFNIIQAKENRGSIRLDDLTDLGKEFLMAFRSDKSDLEIAKDMDIPIKTLQSRLRAVSKAACPDLLGDEKRLYLKTAKIISESTL